jgi:protein O-GlcNAc transferase
VTGVFGRWFGRGTPAAAPPVEPAPDDAATWSSRGADHLEQGRLLDACHAFERALAIDPASVGARVNLAYALLESDAPARAIEHLGIAAAHDPASFDARFMLGSALVDAKEPAAASAHLEAAVALRPQFVPAHVALVQALVAADRPDDAMRAVAAARALHPDALEILLCEGNLHAVARRYDEALATFDAVARLSPSSVGVHVNRSVALEGLRRFDEALVAADEAVRVRATPEATAARARALQALRRFPEAAEAWRRVLAMEPANAEAINQLGVSLYSHGALHEAVACYRRAIELQPKLPGGYANLGLALLDAGDVDGAEQAFRTGLSIRELATLHDNLGIVLQRQSRFDDAIDHHRRAIALDPSNLNTQCNLASAQAKAGDDDDAIRGYRALIALRPDHLVAHSNLLFHLSVDARTTNAEYLDEARRFDAEARRRAIAPYVPPAVRRDGPLRIGFVSGDLRAHPVGYFLEGILRELDPARFSLHAYPTSVHEDALTARLRPLFATWRQLKGVGDAEATESIRADELDVLFDLAGHTGDNRLTLFAARAAPLQVAWLGFFASTGLAAMDFVLADDVCVPPGDDSAFTERIWRMPITRLCFTPPPESGSNGPGPLPADANGHPTFGCFQRFTKVSDRLLGLWKRILDAVPDARLRLMSPQTATEAGRREVARRLVAAGIPAERADLLPPRAREAYLQAYDGIDLVLDTFPYTGGTTTCEALWMGVPTLTRDGDSMIARQGVAMMSAVGLPDWVAEDDDDYVRRAVAFARDRDALRALRGGLRARAAASPLFDVRRFALRFADAIDGMRAAARA